MQEDVHKKSFDAERCMGEGLQAKSGRNYMTSDKDSDMKKDSL